MDNIEKLILTYLKTYGRARRIDLEAYTQKSRGTVLNRLNRLLDRGLIIVVGDNHNPTRTYKLTRKD